MRMRLRADGDEQIPRGPAIGRRLSLAAKADRLPVLDARRNFHGQRFRLPAGAREAQTHLAPGYGGPQRHFHIVTDVGARLARRAAATATAAAAVASASKLKTAPACELSQQVL